MFRGPGGQDGKGRARRFSGDGGGGAASARAPEVRPLEGRGWPCGRRHSWEEIRRMVTQPPELGTQTVPEVAQDWKRCEGRWPEREGIARSARRGPQTPPSSRGAERAAGSAKPVLSWRPFLRSKALSSLRPHACQSCVSAHPRAGPSFGHMARGQPSGRLRIPNATCHHVINVASYTVPKADDNVRPTSDEIAPGRGAGWLGR